MDRREAALEIFLHGLQAADPRSAVAQHLGKTAPGLILAVGKAATAMAEPAMEAFPGVRTLIVTNYENATEIDGAEVFAAGHPVPDENGLLAARAVKSALEQAVGQVLVLLSGGGSALLPAPSPPMSLANKAELNAALLASGLDIRAMNLVRQQVSELKGGGLARRARGSVRALVLSDVIGDDLSVIASGPTMPPIGTKAEAVDILKQADIWDALPMTVHTVLSRTMSGVPVPATETKLIGSNAISVAAMADLLPKARVLPPIEGDVAQAAKQICDGAIVEGVTLWGGETTVTIKGKGRGGRNQELALRIAVEARARGWEGNWVCLQAGTDGRDGPTDAAGALVDAGTLDRIGDIRPYLADNDSYTALERARDLLKIGATGTNVADLGVLIRGQATVELP